MYFGTNPVTVKRGRTHIYGNRAHEAEIDSRQVALSLILLEKGRPKRAGSVHDALFLPLFY